MATPTLFEIQCALMSGVADHASRNNQQINMYPVPEGWGLIDRQTKPSGFEATYFAKTNADGTKEIVIAFAPTNTKEMIDIITDIESGLGNVTTQLLQAAEYYMKIRSENPNATITFTGHSLGGGIAALMGIFFNEKAVVFDQAPFAAGQTVEKRSYTSFPLSLGVAAYAKSTPHFS
jgi:hypothetical protein